MRRQRSGPTLDYIAPELRTMAVPIDTLVPDPRNARRHDEKNVDAISRSLEKFGQRIPLVVQRDGMIVRAGNGRLTAARQLGWTHVAAVVVDESDVDATAFALVDNRTSELAAWDYGVLAAQFDDMPDVIGWSEAERDAVRQSFDWAGVPDVDVDSGTGPSVGNPNVVRLRVLDTAQRDAILAELCAVVEERWPGRLRVMR